MTIQDTNFEKNVINFFGDEAVAKKYLALEKIEEKIKLIWTAPIIQVIESTTKRILKILFYVSV